LQNKEIIDIIDLLDDPTGVDKNEAALIELLRLYTMLGKISTGYAWSFFSTGGVIPNLNISNKDTKAQVRNKKMAALLLHSLAQGNQKRWRFLKNKTSAHLITKGQRLCAYCRRQLYIHGSAINIDHVFPKKPKAPDSYSQNEGRRLCFKLDNMVASCIDCNTIKSNNIHMYHPNKCDYSEFMTYNIVISNDFHVTNHEPNSRPYYRHIASEIYKTFRLDRLEDRAILSKIGDDVAIKKMEESLILSEEIDEMSEKIREVYYWLIDEQAVNRGIYY
jgi:hypothetical protein